MPSSKQMPVKYSSGLITAARAVDDLFHAIKDSEKYNHLVPSYIYSVCSCIEGGINNAYIDHFHQKLGKKYYKNVKPYLFMRIVDRFTQLPIIVSNFQYELNMDNPDVREILSLFESRNRFIHVKHMWHYADVTEDETGNILNVEYHNPEHPDPYAPWTSGVYDIDELERWRKILDRIMPKLYNFTGTINRKNFNPEGWFVKIKKT